MRLTPVLLVFMLAAAPAAAQVFLGAEVGPDAFLRSEEGKMDTSGEDAFAWALASEVSSTTLAAVFESTAPEREALRYLRQGIYRQELTALVLMSQKTSVPFKKLAAELSKEGSFRALAKKHKADAMALFAEGGKLKAEVDKLTPLFLVSVSTFAASPPSVSTAPAPAVIEKLEKDDEED
jgi:hypothetical protein